MGVSHRLEGASPQMRRCLLLRAGVAAAPPRMRCSIPTRIALRAQSGTGRPAHEVPPPSLPSPPLPDRPCLWQRLPGRGWRTISVDKASASGLAYADTASASKIGRPDEQSALAEAANSFSSRRVTVANAAVVFAAPCAFNSLCCRPSTLVKDANRLSRSCYTVANASAGLAACFALNSL